MLDGKRYFRMVWTQPGSGGSLGSFGIFTGCPRILKGSSNSFSSSSSAPAGASSFFSSPGGGGGGGGGGAALLGAAEIRKNLHNNVVLIEDYLDDSAQITGDCLAEGVFSWDQIFN